VDDGNYANDFEPPATHKDALNCLKSQDHDWKNTDRWNNMKKYLGMLIAENGLEFELVEETLASNFKYHETLSSIYSFSCDGRC
jgi:hypothetical protein